MQNQITFSIIVPVYNTPAMNMDKMYDSVLSQSYSDYEVIIVDDGSEEKCARFLDAMVSRDHRVRVLHTKNGGVSNARNVGIREAKGEFIAFVDADDIVDYDFLMEAEEYIKKYNPDIVYGTMEYVPQRAIKQNNGRVDVYDKADFIRVKKALMDFNQREIDYRILGTPCARVYRSELVKNVGFRVGVPLYEDQLFNREVLNLANRAIVVHNVWYQYIQNDFSAMHYTMKKSYFKMAKPYWDELYRVDQTEPEELREQLRIHALGLFYTAIQKDYLGPKISLSKKLKDIKKIAVHPLILDAIDNLSILSRRLSKSQKLGLLLLKNKIFVLVYFGQVIKLGRAK